MQEVVKKLAEDKGFHVAVDISNTVYFKPALEITTESIAAYDKAHQESKIWCKAKFRAWQAISTITAKGTNSARNDN